MNRRDTFEMLLSQANDSPAQTRTVRESASRWWDTAWTWLKARHAEMMRARVAKRMRVVENVSLGERRFVALVRVDEREFLIGASTAGVALLQELKKPAMRRKAEVRDDPA